MADQPTPPNLGNITDAAFLALPDWSRTPANQPGPNGELPKPDTWSTFNTCVIALMYRLLRDNMAYLNKALACTVDTPLSLAAKQSGSGAPTLPTDYDATAASENTGSGLADQPIAIYPLNGTPANVTGAPGPRLNSNSLTNDMAYSVVVGHSGYIGAQHNVLGIRNHAARWYYSDDTPAFRGLDIAMQMAVHIPEWPQDSEADIVLAKVANYLSAADTGMSDRIGFEFGLGKGNPVGGIQNSRDYCLYVRWYNSSDVEQRISCVVPEGTAATADALGITPGRRFTLGFHRYFTLLTESWTVDFYVNGDKIGRANGNRNSPSVGTSSNVRLHVGSAQLGKSYCGGPINNVLVWANPSQGGIAGAMRTFYARTEGFATTPVGPS